MPNKTLTAKVKIETRDAERALDRLSQHIKYLNKLVSGGNARGVDSTVQKIDRQTDAVYKQITAQEQLAKQTRTTAAEGDKAAQRLAKAQQKAQHDEYANWWKHELQAQEAQQKELQRAEQLKQKELEKEAIRQRSLKTMGAGDKAAQRLLRNTEAVNRAEYEQWWQQTLTNAELTKSANIVQRLKKVYDSYNTTVSGTPSKVSTITSRIKEWANAQKQIHDSAKSTNNVFTSIGNKLKSLAATYLGIMGIRATTNTSDIITSSENRLNNLEGANVEQTAKTMDKIYAASQRARSGYTDMMANVSKTMTLAGDAFGGSIDNAIRFQEIMAKSYTVGGASAAEQASSMYQLVQALGSGVLQGDELRSVREGAPIAYKAIEKFAQGIYGADKNLKDLASDGLITSNMVVAAIMNAEEKIEDSFNNTQMTFAQAMTNIKNVAVKAFEPLLQKLNDALNSSFGKSIIEGIGTTLVVVANFVSQMMDIIGGFFTWFSDNWYWIQWIVYGVLAAILIYQAIVFAQMIKNAVMAMAVFVANNPWVLWVMGIALLIAAMTWLYQNAQWIFWGIIAIAALTAILFGNWWLLAIVAVAALIAWLVDDFRGAMEVIGGIVYATGAFVYNLVVGILDGLIQAFFSLFVDPVAGIIEWFVNAWNGGFDSVGDAFKNFCGQLLSGLIGLLKPFAKILDKVFGWNTNGAVESAQSSMKSWGTNSKATQYIVKAPTTANIAKLLGFNMPERFDLTDAYANGKTAGGKLADNITNFANNIGNLIGGGASATGLPNPTDPAYALDPYNQGDLLDGIKGDTGSIADNMELTQEDLEFLRRIADMEWKKEYTTAEIKVDMTNYNQLNGDTDLDGLVTKLTDKLNEELNVVANGVYVY